MLGISLLAGIALFSSFYLQYVAGYEPCIYCYILRYLTMGILGLSVFALLVQRWTGDISAALVGAGIVGLAVSAYLTFDELFPSAGICRACSLTPIVFGISLYYYSLAFMTVVVGASVTIFRSD